MMKKQSAAMVTKEIFYRSFEEALKTVLLCK
jgi:hypothetical protein